MNSIMKLGDLVEFQRGYDLPKEKAVYGQYRVVTSNGTMIYHNKFKSEPSVVIGRSGTVGNPQLIKEHFWPHNTTLYVKDFKGNDLEYIYYLLLNMDIGRMKSGSNIPTLNRNHLHPLLINATTDIREQKRIADVLSKIDEKILNNNAINAELESVAKDIYDYWFLQFDFPDENGKPYKSSGGRMVWNEELKKEIPKGWNVGTFNKYIAKDKGGDWGKETEEGNYIKRVICLRGADFPSITGNSQLVAPVRYILEKNMYKVLENGDLIIEISGGSPVQSTGRICYVNNNMLERFDTDIVTSNFCKAISLIDSNYMYWFYIQWLKIYDNNVLFKYEGKTTGIKNLLFDIFVNDYKIAVPPNELIIQYNDMVCVMFEEIQKNQKQSQELASLRDFLLPLLMNGQVGFK